MIWDPAYVAYRTLPDGGYHGNKETRKGEIKLVKAAHKKNPRPPYQPSESDWLVPNLVNPYAAAT